MTINLTELRRLAKTIPTDEWYTAYDLARTPCETLDARFIAACSPAAILALLDRLDRAEAALREERGAKEATSKNDDG